MTAQELLDLLKQTQEPKGYFFNRDTARTLELLEGLLLNKERYGYMCCPCRLAADDRDKDQDIICPCVYRAPDVEAFGSCYCNLYVTPAWNQGEVKEVYIPERRPADKMPF